MVPFPTKIGENGLWSIFENQTLFVLSATDNFDTENSWKLQFAIVFNNENTVVL